MYSSFFKVEIGEIEKISCLRPRDKVLMVSVQYTVKQSSSTLAADGMHPIGSVTLLGRKRFVATVQLLVPLVLIEILARLSKTRMPFSSCQWYVQYSPDSSAPETPV